MSAYARMSSMKRLAKADGFENQYLFVLSREFVESVAQDPLFLPLRVTDIGYFPNAQYHYRQRIGGIGESVLLLCVAGEGFYKIGDADTTGLSAGQAVLLPPGITHTYGASLNNPWSVYWFHYVGTSAKALSDLLCRYQPLKTAKTELDTCVEMFRHCFALLKKPYQRDAYFSVCQMALAICSVLNCTAKQKDLQLTEKGDRAIQVATQFMKEHLHATLSLEQIAMAVNFSASHLHTMFKAATGQSPIQYFLHMKMQAAGKALYFTDRSIRDIAASFGIEDACYFSRIFKKVMGMSPIGYRNQTKG